ncbi:hypothetical protein F8G81_05530 [Arthrobacter sp. CDRTa11]|uniref:PLDc N-terminal domain-containing protein n=1 Tax=Arthrobacter sp. CDRTa11 TaxID=2651199 RepID=UPI002265C674|nr:PLDc N-terminal domain-containing protein [Arthrobacter sp. CDRTa11]UZX02138.1 hypothetical protein F8G81_05530 [Arthrobacter sp. CDRTa11]
MTSAANGLAGPLTPTFGILGFMLMAYAVLIIAALISIARNRTYTSGGMLVWALIVLALPVLGPVLWFLTGRRPSPGGRASALRK